VIPVYVLLLFQRLWFWMKLYNPALKLIPAPKSTIEVWARQYRPTIELFPDRTQSKALRVWRDVKGFLFFTGLFRRDKVLWLGSWLFHASLAILFLLHLKWILPLTSFVDGEVIRHAGRSAGWVLLVSALGLLVRRLLVTRVRQITSTADYVAELLFALAVATGLWVVYDRPDTEAIHNYLASLARFSPDTAGIPLSVVVHLLTVQALFVVMPFSHLLHSGGIFIARRFLASPDSFSGDVD
jgi:nitrate reductase gamma subunit